MRFVPALAALLLSAAPAWPLDLPANTSQETRACVDCHTQQTPGIVYDWLTSRHARTLPREALTKPPLERRVSAQKAPAELAGVTVGCHECHSLRPQQHADNFAHFGRRINVVVSPADCATCHPEEARQFGGSKKAHAWGNLVLNPVYNLLVESVTSVKELREGELARLPASEEAKWETCLGCHGTKVEVKGTRRLQTAIGAIEVPNLLRWPNQGVGRLNPDGSRGSCASCHARHAFHVADARHPYTCGQCHLEPDVPGWNVYKESKHGNIYEARESTFNYEAVPWRVGRDFTTPTCAACHNALVVDERGEPLAQRSHDFGARLWVRLFGLIYSHPEPRGGDTSIISNAEGQPLPTTFAGRPAGEFLISAEEGQRRQEGMERVCRGCHSGSWTAGHMARLAATNRETDQMVAAATALMQRAWQAGLADPANPFDEAAELLWVRQWLFYANSVRYASAMSGAPDYAAFKNGWWSLSETVAKLAEKAKVGPPTPSVPGGRRPAAGGSTGP